MGDIIERLGELPASLLITVAAVSIALGIAMLTRAKWAIPVISGLYFLASIGVAKNYAGVPQYTFLAPLEIARSDLFLLAGGFLYVGVLGQLGRLPRRAIPGISAIVLAMAVFAGLLRLIHDGPVDSLLSLVFATATILPIAILVPAMCRNWEDFADVLRGLGIANAIWIACVVVQFLFFKSSVLTVDRSARFVGLTGNPQHAGTYLAGGFVIALWLLLNDHRRSWRFLWWGIIGMNAIFIAWTGSRTGAAMAVLGSTICLYSRVGRSVIYLPAVVLALWLAFQLAGMLGIELVTERLASTENTRGGAWATLVESALANPLLGAGISEAGDSENSYLYGLASYGIGMALLMLVLVVAAVRIGWRLFMLRWRLAPLPGAVIDFTLAYLAMYFAGAVFEGYMLARVAPPLVMILITGGFAAAILNRVDEDEEIAAVMGEEYVAETIAGPPDEPSDDWGVVDGHLAREY